MIPEVTDDDINWVCELMGLQDLDHSRCTFLKERSTIDVSACPGSGKTTLIVAKLAIISRKWPYSSRGICVLSHTNVAGDEIRNKLGGTAVAQRLLNYPHFIGTIHGFINRFLALPWLYSKGFPVMAVNDEITTAFRRRCLGGRRFSIIEKFLWNRYRDRKGFKDLRICDIDFDFDLRGGRFLAGPDSDSYKFAQEAVMKSACAGYFCYDEMFVWANALLKECPNLPLYLAQRFPLVFIDEMQDTSSTQGSLINAMFPRKSMNVVVQRVGDPNQAIFDGMGAKASKTDPFPDINDGRCINIHDSFRFGGDISKLASPFAINKVMPNGLVGIGPPKNNHKSIPSANTIFIFSDDQIDGVLNAYGKHVLANLPDSLLKNGVVTAVGGVHKDARSIKPGHFLRGVSLFSH